MPDSVGANLETVRQTIARSAERAGRDPSEVVLVAVTKTFPVERIREALAVGLRILMVQSLDSVGLVEALDGRIQSPLDVLVEVNVAEEPQKTGVLPADLGTVAGAVNAAQHLRLRGLMTVTPMVPAPGGIRPIFRRLGALREKTSQQLGVALPVLSMGMTDDYAIAIEEGATMLRLGRALFGRR